MMKNKMTIKKQRRRKKNKTAKKRSVHNRGYTVINLLNVYVQFYVACGVYFNQC
jgi:hypothetical protein